MFDGFGLFLGLLMLIAILLIIYTCAMTIILLIAYWVYSIINKIRGKKKDEQV